MNGLEHGDEAPRILHLGIRWWLVVGFKFRPIYLSVKSSRFALDIRMIRPLIWCRLTCTIN